MQGKITGIEVGHMLQNFSQLKGVTNHAFIDLVQTNELLLKLLPYMEEYNNKLELTG
jgi:hypothetical protein